MSRKAFPAGVEVSMCCSVALRAIPLAFRSWTMSWRSLRERAVEAGYKPACLFAKELKEVRLNGRKFIAASAGGSRLSWLHEEDLRCP
jgi:hypothetical protein